MLKKELYFLFSLLFIICIVMFFVSHLFALESKDTTSVYIKDKVELDKAVIMAGITCGNYCTPDWLEVCNGSNCCTGSYLWGYFSINANITSGAVGEPITVIATTTFTPVMPPNTFPSSNPCCSNFNTWLDLRNPDGTRAILASGTSTTTLNYTPTISGRYTLKAVAAGYAIRLCKMYSIYITDDNDGDGYTITEGDCNDNDNTIYPNAPELCDNKDNDCDGQIDENVYSLQRISPEEITIPVGTTTEVLLSVGVICKTSGSVSGKNVLFRIVSGSGASLSCSSSQTGSDGLATCNLRLPDCTPGEYVIQASMNGVVDGTSPITFVVKVVGSAGNPVSVTIIPADRKICGGIEGVWTAEVLDASGSPIGAGCLTFKWTIRKGNDRIYGPVVGSNKFRYTFPEDFDGTYKIEVTACKKRNANVCVNGNATVQVSPLLKIKEIVIDPAQISASVGETVKFTATAKDESGNEISTGELNWQWVVNGEIQDAGSNILNYTFTTEGQYTITVSACPKKCEGSVEACKSASVVVEAKAEADFTVHVSPKKSNVLVGQSMEFKAVCKDKDGNILPSDQFIYKWYVEGVEQEGKSGDTFIYTLDEFGDGNIEIKVKAYKKTVPTKVNKIRGLTPEDIATVSAVKAELIEISFDNSIDLYDNVSKKDIKDPEWSDKGNYPVCYVKGKKVFLIAKVKPTDRLTTRIRITITVSVKNGPNLEFEPVEINIHNEPVAFNTGSKDALPNFVDYYDNDFILRWEYSVDIEGKKRNVILQSNHTLFVIHNTPIAPMQKPWVEVLKYGCEWAKGKSTDMEIGSQLAYSIWGVTKFDYDPGNAWYTDLGSFLIEKNDFKLKKLLNDLKTHLTQLKRS